MIRTSTYALALLLLIGCERLRPVAGSHVPRDFDQPKIQYAATMTADTTSLALQGQRVFLEGPCAMCHTIRGTIALSRVGPDLTHLASRRMIAAGTLPNTRGNLAGWILNPQKLKPGAKMPPTMLSSDDLRALLVYLETLH